MLKETGTFIQNLRPSCLGGPKLETAKKSLHALHAVDTGVWKLPDKDAVCDRAACRLEGVHTCTEVPADQQYVVQTAAAHACIYLAMHLHNQNFSKLIEDEPQAWRKNPGIPRAASRLSKLKQLHLINLMKNICNVHSSVPFVESCYEPAPETGLPQLLFISFQYWLFKSGKWAVI